MSQDPLSLKTSIPTHPSGMTEKIFRAFTGWCYLNGFKPIGTGKSPWGDVLVAEKRDFYGCEVIYGCRNLVGKLWGFPWETPLVKIERAEARVRQLLGPQAREDPGPFPETRKQMAEQIMGEKHVPEIENG